MSLAYLSPAFRASLTSGHNGRVAWSVTHTNGDYQDLYIERFNDADPSLYQWQGDWRNAEVRDEVIKVRGGQDVALRTWATHHGPVVAGEPPAGAALALRYSGRRWRRPVAGHPCRQCWKRTASPSWPMRCRAGLTR